MTLTITRQNVCRFERLVSKLFPLNGAPRMISIVDAGNECRLIAVGKEHALTMTVPGSNGNVSLDMPWTTVKEIVTRKVGLVMFNISKQGATVSWDTNGIPQQKPVDLTDGADEPVLPARMETVSPGLLDALTAGTRCVDPDNKRYSLGSLCLRGATNQVVSTDGRQAFFQDGYEFPWKDDVLCPVSKIFGSKELGESAQSVRIGADENWIYFEVGNVSFRMKPIEGKFPRLDTFHQNIGHFTWFHPDPVEAAFVADRVANLPGAEEKESPIYLELGNGIAVRGHDSKLNAAVEIRMPKSRYEGKAAKVAVNRRFLKNALESGMNRIGVDPDERTPLVCTGDGMMFVIMPLEGDEPKCENVTVLAPDGKSVTAPAPVMDEPDDNDVPERDVPQAPRSKRTKAPTVPKPGAETVPQPIPETAAEQPKSISRLEAVAEAENLYVILKDASIRAKTLIRQLKGSRKLERDLLRREQELDKERQQLDRGRQQLDKGRQRLLEAATLIGKV